MIGLITSYFTWMPAGVQVVAVGITALFMISFLLHLVTFLFDLLPWR